MFSNGPLNTDTQAFRQSLKVVPVRNAGVRVLSSDERELRVEVALRYSRAQSILRRIIPARDTRRYVFDGVGREVYESIDGKKDFERLIDEFAERHRLTFFEARALLASYLQLLVKSALVVATLPKASADPASGRDAGSISEP